MNSNEDEKYASMFTNNDVYILDIISDGIHQNLGIIELFRSVIKLLKFPNKYIILDRFFNGIDFLNLLFKIPFISIVYLNLINRNYLYKDIDISSLIVKEQIYSFSKNMRLLSLYPKLIKIRNLYSIDKIFFTLFEYPYGKLISHIFYSLSNCTTIGVQHGPASIRKLYHYIPIQDDKNTINDFIPKKVLCEDVSSMKVYKEGKYKNIDLMPEVYRLNYLRSVKRIKAPSLNIIFGGLHDSNLILSELEEFIKLSNDSFYFKSHPRSKLNISTKKIINNLPNLKITKKHPVTLFTSANKVICTYSSIALEALKLGINVIIVDLPGVINLSPLSYDNDLKKHYKNLTIEFISRDI